MLLDMRAVTRTYPSVAGAPPATVLRGIDLQLQHGQSLAIIGPSGSGKSTLLHLAGALDLPTTGSVRFEGTDLGTLGDRELGRLRNRSIGFVFQAHHLLPQCTVLENVLLPTLAGTHDAARMKQRATDLLGRVGLGEHMHHKPGQLSGGQRQRVAVVRALILEPRLLLADEPTGALDSHTALDLFELLLRMQKETGVALMVVTHAAELASRLQRCARLQDGTLTEQRS